MSYSAPWLSPGIVPCTPKALNMYLGRERMAGWMMDELTGLFS